MALMRLYLQILRYRPAQLLLAGSAPARLSYAMISLGIYFKVYHATGSISVAGLASGVNGLAGAFTAGIRASLIDRFGLVKPLAFLVPAYGVMIVLFNYSHGQSLLLVASFLLGLSAPPINLSVRPMWKTTVPEEWLRATFAVDTAVMGITAVLGPVLATTLALSRRPNDSLNLCAASMIVGGLALLVQKSVRTWRPEAKVGGAIPLWRTPAIRLLMLEGAFIGLGMGSFDIGLPAITTLHHVAARAGYLFSVLALCSIAGSLLAGIAARRLPPLKVFRRVYLAWMLLSIPMIFLSPNWLMFVVVGGLGFCGGAQHVFYLEIMEAVRPVGAAAGALGLLWTIEGSMSAAGTSLGGYLAQLFGPHWCFGVDVICVFVGFWIIARDKVRLSAANIVPSSRVELDAISEAGANDL